MRRILFFALAKKNTRVLVSFCDRKKPNFCRTNCGLTDKNPYPQISFALKKRKKARRRRTMRFFFYDEKKNPQKKKIALYIWGLFPQTPFPARGLGASDPQPSAGGVCLRANAMKIYIYTSITEPARQPTPLPAGGTDGQDNRPVLVSGDWLPSLRRRNEKGERHLIG